MNRGRASLDTRSRLALAQKRLYLGNPLHWKQQYGLLLWMRTDVGVIYGTTMRGGGTAPPTWTLSGTAVRPVNIHAEIDSVAGGTALGQATYRWRENENAAYTSGVLTAAGPTALGTTGLSVAQAVGPYDINNTWDITASQGSDFSGLGNHGVMATAGNQPRVSLTGFGGYPCFVWEGDRRLIFPSTNFMGTMIFALNATTGALRFWNRLTQEVQTADSVENTSRLLPPESARKLTVPLIGAGRLTYGRTYQPGSNASHTLYVNGQVAAQTAPVTGDASPPANGSSLGGSFGGGSNFAGDMHEVIGFEKPVPAYVMRYLHAGILARAPGAIV